MCRKFSRQITKGTYSSPPVAWIYPSLWVNYYNNEGLYLHSGLYASFLKGQGHQGIFSLAKGTLWGNCKFLLEHFKGTKAMARGNGGNRLRCLREVSGLYTEATGHATVASVAPGLGLGAPSKVSRRRKGSFRVKSHPNNAILNPTLFKFGPRGDFGSTSWILNFGSVRYSHYGVRPFSTISVTMSMTANIQTFINLLNLWVKMAVTLILKLQEKTWYTNLAPIY